MPHRVSFMAAGSAAQAHAGSGILQGKSESESEGQYYDEDDEEDAEVALIALSKCPTKQTEHDMPQLLHRRSSGEVVHNDDSSISGASDCDQVAPLESREPMKVLPNRSKRGTVGGTFGEHPSAETLRKRALSRKSSVHSFAVSESKGRQTLSSRYRHSADIVRNNFITRHLTEQRRFIPLIEDKLSQFNLKQGTAKEAAGTMPLVDNQAYLEWDDWLQTRLHPSGAIVLVEKVLEAGKAGEFEALQVAMTTVRQHGEGLVESLRHTPVPQEQRKMAFEALRFRPDGRQAQLLSVWEWAEARTAQLEQAEQALQDVLKQASELIAKAKKGPSTVKGPQAKMAPQAGRRKQVLQVVDESPRRRSSAGTCGHAYTVGGAVQGCGEEFADQIEGKQLALFRKLAAKAKDIAQTETRRRRSTVSTTLHHVFYVFTQQRFRECVGSLKAKIKTVDEIGLRCETRRRAANTLQNLREEQEALFFKFATTEDSTIRALDAAAGFAEGSGGGVFSNRLEDMLLSAKNMVGASSLIGDDALRAAEAAGIRRRREAVEKDDDSDSDWEPEEPMENPWANLHIDPPPWEATFLHALRIYQTETRDVSSPRSLEEKRNFCLLRSRSLHMGRARTETC